MPVATNQAPRSSSRPQRNTGPPDKYSPDRGASSSWPKPNVLGRVKARVSKEKALDCPYSPEATLKKGKSNRAFGGVFAHPCDVISGAPIGYAMPVYPIGAQLLTPDGWANTPPKALSLFKKNSQIFCTDTIHRFANFDLDGFLYKQVYGLHSWLFQKCFRAWRLVIVHIM